MAALEDQLGKQILDDKFNEFNVKELKCKIVGLYFSAHWCPPCRSFTPVLVDFYNKLKEMGKSVEIIFISSDKDDESFREYFGSMPWKAMAFDNENKAKLQSKYGVSGIPCLVLINGETGELITKDGRSVVNNKDVDKFMTI